MIRTFLIISIQIIILFLAMLGYFSGYIVLISLVIGTIYSFYAIQTTGKKSLFVGHLIVIILLLFWIYIPPYLFSN